MKKISLAFALITAGLISPVTNAQFLDNFKISNGSPFPISLKGDRGLCTGQTNPQSINIISKNDFDKLCLGKNCEVKVYPNFSCASAWEYTFDFNFEYGIGAITPYSPKYITAEAFKDILFVAKKNT